MELRTGRYMNPGVHQEIVAGNIYPVGHTVGNPPPQFRSRFKHRNLRILGPERDWLELPKDHYQILYRQKLDALGLESVAWHLQGIVDSVQKPLALLCFENLDNPDAWCHRRMFAAWWTAHTSLQVPEIPEATIPTALDAPAGYRTRRPVSKATQEKAHRLLAEGRVQKVEGGFRVKGDNGVYDVNEACDYCSCPARVRCSHMIAGAFYRDGIKPTLL